MVKDQELELLFKNMLEEQEEVTRSDQVYREDIKDFPLRVQWFIGDLMGYQIFELDNYSYEFGTELDEPDLTLIIKDREPARLFLTGEMGDYSIKIPKHDYEGEFEYIYTVEWKKVETEEGMKNKRTTKPFLTVKFDKAKKYHPFILQKLPMFRKLREKVVGKNNYAVYVPINQSLNYENQVIPLKVFKNFIDKACSIVVEDICGCRLVHECKDHDVSLGCMHMGADTERIDLDDLERGIPQNIPGRYVSKEEAYERVKLAYEDGLIPLLGRSRAEAIASGVTDTGRILSMCFCCSCCCVNGSLIRNGSPSLSNIYRFEGITVKVDEDVCVGCEECMSVCAFNGMEMIDGIARVNQEKCLGCGRCEQICPNGAISIKIDDTARIDELISKIESYADVS